MATRLQHGQRREEEERIRRQNRSSEEEKRQRMKELERQKEIEKRKRNEDPRVKDIEQQRRTNDPRLAELERRKQQDRRKEEELRRRKQEYEKQKELEAERNRDQSDQYRLYLHYQLAEKHRLEQMEKEREIIRMLQEQRMQMQQNFMEEHWNTGIWREQLAEQHRREQMEKERERMRILQGQRMQMQSDYMTEQWNTRTRGGEAQRKYEELNRYPGYRKNDYQYQIEREKTLKEQASRNLLVGSIDFGTTYSGWACSFLYEFESDRTKAYVRHWYSGSGSLTTEKTPTCVLVRPDGKTLAAFGYEAENKYKELVDAEEHEGYYYFKKFKMMLNKKLGEKLERRITLEDEMGRSLLALDVFAMAIKYLKDDMLLAVKDRQTGVLQVEDVHWVLTVPAIWTDGAKQFMREAATKAGIIDKHLTVALEPEAASLYCRNLSVETTVDHSDVSVAKFKAGTQYMILDAGGGTIDITVHEVERSGGLKEVHAACGGGWGGTVVDKAFENLLFDLFTKRVYEKFKLKETEDWLDLWRDFEVKKRAICPTKPARINMKFPISLIALYKKETGRSISDSLSSSKYADDISFAGDKMKFSADIFKSLFDTSIGKTVDYVKGVIRDAKVKAILMVGGFSESPMLQHAVKSSFSGVHVVIPKDASSAILRGALIYGHSPKSITERMLKYTYGIETSEPFIKGKHPESKRIRYDEGDFCGKIFGKHVEKNQLVKVGEPQVERTYRPVYKTQTSLDFPIYASGLKDPQYTDQGCTLVGNLNAELIDHDGDLQREVFVSLTFSGTEIVVKATDTKTGIETNATIDFLG